MTSGSLVLSPATENHLQMSFAVLRKHSSWLCVLMFVTISSDVRLALISGGLEMPTLISLTLL